MKSVKQDGGESVRKWHAAHRLHLLRISGKPSKTLCLDQLNVTICCRYIESLLSAPRINRYLSKYHPDDLRQLRGLLDEFEQTCEMATSNDDPR